MAHRTIEAAVEARYSMPNHDQILMASENGGKSFRSLTEEELGIMNMALNTDVSTDVSYVPKRGVTRDLSDEEVLKNVSEQLISGML